MNREVEVGKKKYRITIGYGAFQRLDALAVFIRATEPASEKDAEDVPTETEPKKAAEVATAVLKSEEIATAKEVEDIKILGDLGGGGYDFFDILNAEQKLTEKVHEVKVRMLQIAVRDAKTNTFLNADFIEYDLIPSHGEELFNLVMETFELIQAELTDEDRKKKS